MDSHNPNPAQSSQTKQLTSDDANVAVIAIHGVGQHPPGVSADAVATLLQSIGRCNVAMENDRTRELEAPYSGFIAGSVDVPLRPVQSPTEDARMANYRGQRSWVSTVWGIFNERRGYLAAARAQGDYVPLGYTSRELRPGEPDRGEYAYQFMLTQIAGYQGEADRNFQTIRLEGKRAAKSRAANVHIYDSHYSDLTKPQSSILGFFFAFYQLLFHLASLSLLAVYWAEAENVKRDKGRMWRWRIGSSLQASAVRLLIMAVPFLNLSLLAIACSAFADKATSWSLPIGLLIAAVLGVVVTFLLVRQAPSPSGSFLWAAVPFGGTALGMLALGGSAYLYDRAFQVNIGFAETLLLLGWLICAGIVIAFIGKKFDPLRPGAFFLSIALFVFNVLLFLLKLLPKASLLGDGHNQVATASLWAVQWIFGELLVSWIICLLCAFISWPVSLVCVHGIKNDNPRKARAIAAFRTGRFAFSIPAILFVIVTCALWSGVVVYGSDKLKAFDEVSATSPAASEALPSILLSTVDSVEKWIDRNSHAVKASDCPCPPAAAAKNSPYWSKYLTGLLLVSVTPGLPVTMTMFVLSMLLLTWAVLPSVIFEWKPELTQNIASDRIRSLGEWVSRGLDNTAILTRMLWCAIVPAPLLFFALDWLVLQGRLPGGQDALDYASKATLPLITAEGLILALSGAAIFAFILKYLTTVLDTILDVDNYLRTSPKDRTPRALIAERCTSLLRYIATYRDDQNRPYSKVIIVAHSLGSMVTTDLLRYLERSATDSPDPGLERYGFRLPAGTARELPIHVFSMGCPLRQLLNRFFPHLYWWVSDVPDNSLASVGSPVGPPMPGITSTLPRSDEMNVTHWSNAYRSGDYVGRSLWVGQWFARNGTGKTEQPPDAAETGRPQSCTEMCIGSGAHTHYWDRTAPEIADRLDQLIS